MSHISCLRFLRLLVTSILPSRSLNNVSWKAVPTQDIYCILWRRVESYNAYALSSKRTLGKPRGSLLMTDYNGHTI